MFHATAYNAKGDTFRFTFRNVNWNGAEKAAADALAAIVAADSLHIAHGPWLVRNIDIGM